MKKLLILGGSYFVGRVFIEELIKDQSLDIFVLNRGKIPLRKQRVSELICDRHDLDRMKHVVPAVNWHAIVDFCAYQPEDIAGVFDNIPKGRIGQYIYVSTASVYQPTWDLPISEDTPKLTGLQPELGPFADYGFNKWLAELELQKQCRRHGLPYTIIRPAFIYGKYNYAPRENYFFDLIVKNERIIIPDNSLSLFSFVSVWDVARILFGCIGSETVFNQAFNASAPELISYRRLLQILEIVVEQKLAFEAVPVNKIVAQQIPLPFPLDQHLVYSGTRVQSKIDIEYTPFIKGLKETYRYYKIGRGLS